jgi:hypothetical protein
MPWSKPLSLSHSGGVFTETITVDTWVGDLYTYLGSPGGPIDVIMTADGANYGGISITNDFAPTSTFTFYGINGGAFVGAGGNGGAGGDDFGASGNPGSHGSNGGHAIASNTFDVDIDIDDGYLLGGGGGGGGGSFKDNGADGDPGGGGGGGQGFFTTTGGAAGSPSGTPVAQPGGDGDKTGPGLAGAGGDASNGGGDGGIWGAGGIAGRSTAIGGPGISLHGGTGGRAGRAFAASNGATISFIGVSGESALRLVSRIKGATTEFYVNMPSSIVRIDSVSGVSSHGFSFETDGELEHLDGAGGSYFANNWGLPQPTASAGDDFEIRLRNLAGDSSGTWDFTGAAAGTFASLSTLKQWGISSSAGIEFATGMFELRLASSPVADEIIDSFILSIADENGV